MDENYGQVQKKKTEEEEEGNVWGDATKMTMAQG